MQGGGMIPPEGGMPQGTSEAGQAPITDEQRQVLADMVSDLTNKLNDLKSLRFASSNKTDIIRRALLKRVFEKLQAAGVDLNDQTSVSDFLGKLRAESPEMAQMFESAMNALLGGQEPTTDDTMPQQDIMNNINQNEVTPPRA